MKKYLTILLLSISIAGFGQRHNLIFEDTFETTAGISMWPNHQTCCSYSNTRSTDSARAGSYSMRVELNKTDALVAGSRRAEQALSPESNVIIERWYGYSIMYPTGYTVDKEPELSWQLHSQSTLDLPPPFAIWNTSNRLTFLNYWWTATTGLTSDQLTATHSYSQTDLGAITAGHWMDIVIHIKNSYTSAGLLEVWVNGVKKLTQNGPNIYNETQGLYQKGGLYKWPWNGANSSPESSRVLYIDEVRVGNELATYNDVAPGSPANTLPIAVPTVDSTSITLPTNHFTLSGIGSHDPDGSVVSYHWTKLSGPASGVFVSQDSATTQYTDLKLAGTYIFQLTVTDNAGGTSSPVNISVTVNPPGALGNLNPIANAGLPQQLTTGTTSTTLDATGSHDPDGSIASYSWIQIGEPTVTITGPTTATPTISGLSDGNTYLFQVLVTDNQGATATATVSVLAGLKKKDTTGSGTSNGSLLISSVTAVRGKLNITATGATGNIKFTLMSANGSLITYINDKKKTATQSFSYSYSTFAFPARRTYSLKATVGNIISKTVSFTTK